MQLSSARPETGQRYAAFSSATLLALLTAVAIYLCWRMAAPFVNAFTWAFALTIACAPLRRWLLARMPPVAATLLIMALVVMVIAAPLMMMLTRLLQESIRAQSLLRSSFGTDEWRNVIESNRWAGSLWAWIDQQLDIGEIGRQAAAMIASWIGPVVARSASAISQTGIALLVFFFFLRDQETILGGVAGMLPLSAAETTALFERVSTAVRTAVYGRVFVGMVQGLLGGVIFALLGLPAPVFWAAIMSLLSVLPMLGAFLVWVPAGFFLLAGGHWIRALILLIWGVGVIHTADNFLYPILAGPRMGLHPLVLFVAFVGGLLAFGPAGLILGPCIVAFAAGLAEIWRRRMAVISDGGN